MQLLDRAYHAERLDAIDQVASKLFQYNSPSLFRKIKVERLPGLAGVAASQSFNPRHQISFECCLTLASHKKEIRNGLMFDFYTGLPHIVTILIGKYSKVYINSTSMHQNYLHVLMHLSLIGHLLL